jgi:cyclic beta-1,2-glucan synthetase
VGPQTLCLQPALPGHWPGAQITLRREGRTLRFQLLRLAPDAARQEAGGAAQLLLPGQPLAWPALVGDHAFVVPLGPLQP